MNKNEDLMPPMPDWRKRERTWSTREFELRADYCMQRAHYVWQLIEELKVTLREQEMEILRSAYKSEPAHIRELQDAYGRSGTRRIRLSEAAGAWTAEAEACEAIGVARCRTPETYERVPGIDGLVALEAMASNAHLRRTGEYVAQRLDSLGVDPGITPDRRPELRGGILYPPDELAHSF